MHRHWQRYREERPIFHIEDQWSGSLTKNDIGKLERILADEFIQIGCWGKSFTKQDIINSINNKDEYYRSPGQEMKCTINGDTATLVGIDVVSNSFSICDEVQFTHVFKRQGGIWRVVSAKEDAIE